MKSVKNPAIESRELIWGYPWGISGISLFRLLIFRAMRLSPPPPDNASQAVICRGLTSRLRLSGSSVGFLLGAETPQRCQQPSFSLLS